MKKISFILIIFFLLIGQNIAANGDSINFYKDKARRVLSKIKVDEVFNKYLPKYLLSAKDAGEVELLIREDKTLTFKEKRKIEALLDLEWDRKRLHAKEIEVENKLKEENEIWGLIEKNNYTAALQKVKKAKYLSLLGKFRLKRIINLQKETNIPTSKDKIEALELKTKKLELQILSLEGNLEKIKDDLGLETLKTNRDVSSIQANSMNLEESAEALKSRIINLELR